ncbi:hypothetical protein RHAL1_03398 [Beijerinckiaceae bacterium RH AL1]|nr:LarC family nickel insertion protein [Beijerinckiaceae bacterium]VVB48591.1 hypothetical protein RHCH11_RHCH11_03332 [Beijerinckiaceae bacterium RH CH11]VVB48672.1 hypothetical protein RHAL8_03328 [Beijerinckiaceae bacterium RH AL8]VVC56471.1 hypothetical protein RHAL1_03398 [Beijerinckiaceae bacterium RH AL1]
MHIHLDAIGGAAGDMFAAALLDAFPHLEADTLATVQRVAPVTCKVVDHNDGVLRGRRFDVARRRVETDGHHHHHHRHWSDIRALLLDADLPDTVRDHAVGIFTHLAEAEAEVHGIAVADVAFHEVGAWDSIADIVAAACLIVSTGATTWSVGSLPLGSGRVTTAHGLLPVPAPATAILLRGFEMLDDGIAGERVTPTGAAILRHLRDTAGATPPRRRVMGRSGLGFGMRKLAGVSNCLRVLVFDDVAAGAGGSHRELGVIEFEVDDQSPEDLAMGLDRLRAHADIFDVVQIPVYGKKGRMMMHVRVLARSGAIDDAIAACFRETTTIGLRHHVVSGAALPRDIREIEVDGATVRVKRVDRPGGRTAKAEADDAMAHETHARRASIRRRAERLALSDDAAE